MLRKMLVASSLVATVNAQAAQWWGFTEVMSDHVMTYFDAESLTHQGQSVNVWVNFIYNNAFRKADGPARLMQKYRYNCKAHTAQVLQSTFYSPTGEITGSSNAPYDPDDVIPGSIGESMYKAACTPGFPVVNKLTKPLLQPIAHNDPDREAQEMFKYLAAKAASAAGH